MFEPVRKQEDRAGTAVNNIVTNELHGSAFEFLRNGATNGARQRAVGARKDNSIISLRVAGRE
jgi:hypothetical protein